MEKIFEPACGSHALLETVFFAQFAPEIESGALDQLGEKLERSLEFLPKKTEMKGVKIVIADQQPESASASLVNGWEFSRVAPDGNVEWVLRFNAEGLSVHCLAYTRWDEVWPQAESLLLAALEAVPSGTGLVGIGLKVIDRFEFVGSALEAYNLEALLRRPNAHVADSVFSAGHRWHCHIGWFDPLSDASKGELENGEVLNQLNVDGAPQVGPAGQKIFVTIDHNQVTRNSQKPIEIDPSKHDWLGLFMHSLHGNNKRKLYDLLVDDMCRRINLSAGGGE